MKTRAVSVFALALFGAASLVITPAEAWRGGGFGGVGGFHGGDFGPRGPGGFGPGFRPGPPPGPRPGGWGGGYGYHGPVVVNSYARGGCYGCGAAALGAAAVGTAAVVGAAEANAAARNYAIGATLATLPPDCVENIVNGASYSICGSTWFAPRYGADGLYFVAVPPL
jgi:hypothetical protein